MEARKPVDDAAPYSLAIQSAKAPRACQACGTAILLGKRKYCHSECRKRLVLKLSSAMGLLRAMHTRCATFSFSENTIVLNVSVYGSRDVFGFIRGRRPGRTPAQDLGALVEDLGRAWWRENRIRGSRHQASMRLLEAALKHDEPAHDMLPSQRAVPKVGIKNLTVLRISRADLLAQDAWIKIKAAYRREALKHHPDKNGDAASFRRVQEAYEELSCWIQSPVIVNKKGLPGKWCFNGKTWTPPLS